MYPTPPRRPNPGFSLNPSEWHAQELLLMREVMRGIGRSLAPALVLREMLHLMSELLGLNRGRIVLADPASTDPRQARTASIQHAYGLTQAEVARGALRLGRRRHRPRAGHGPASHRAGHRRRAAVPVPRRGARAAAARNRGLHRAAHRSQQRAHRRAGLPPHPQPPAPPQRRPGRAARPGHAGRAVAAAGSNWWPSRRASWKPATPCWRRR